MVYQLDYFQIPQAVGVQRIVHEKMREKGVSTIKPGPMGIQEKLGFKEPRMQFENQKNLWCPYCLIDLSSRCILLPSPQNAQVLPRHSYSMFLLIFLLPLPTSYLTPILRISEILFSYGFCFPVSFATSWSLLLFLFLCVCLASVSLPYQLHMFSLCVTFIFLKRKNLSSSANHIYMVYSYFAVPFAGPPHRSRKITD